MKDRSMVIQYDLERIVTRMIPTRRKSRTRVDEPKIHALTKFEATAYYGAHKK